jgi:hypothetical protein
VKTYFLFYKARVRAHFWSKSNKFQFFRCSKTENKIQIFDDKKTFDKQNKLQKGVIFLKVRILNFLCFWQKSPVCLFNKAFRYENNSNYCQIRCDFCNYLLTALKQENKVLWSSKQLLNVSRDNMQQTTKFCLTYRWWFVEQKLEFSSLSLVAWA